MVPVQLQRLTFSGYTIGRRHINFSLATADPVAVDINNMYVGSPYCRAQMYAGRIACCPLVSHSKYADGTDGHTDGQRDG